MQRQVFAIPMEEWRRRCGHFGRVFGRGVHSAGVSVVGFSLGGVEAMPRLSHARSTIATGVALAGLATFGVSQASYSTYRQSCAGSVATPVLSAGAPVVGVDWTLAVTGLGPGAAGTLLFGLRDDSLGPSPLPLDLGPLGAPGCSLNVNSDPGTGAMAVSLVADPAGRVVWSLRMPDLAGALGFTFHNQYVSLEAPSGRALPITTTNAGRGVVGLPGVPNMVPIPAGSFSMGSNQGLSVEQPVHTVHITRPFWIGKYEVTQAEWQGLLGTNPSGFPGPNRPVERVTWYDVMAYCAALTAREGAVGRLPEGYQYRLPTEAEWEYCCRAGTTTEWNVGNSLNCGHANFWQGIGGVYCVGSTSTVGSYPASAWGIHDMHGNVWEWCLDSWDGSANYPSGPVSDPRVSSGPYRVYRGGGWSSIVFDCRSAVRYGLSPVVRFFNFGFRVVLAPVLVP
jgi:formylglycine-generating enzyme required for sulfatase activity